MLFIPHVVQEDSYIGSIGLRSLRQHHTYRTGKGVAQGYLLPVRFQDDRPAGKTLDADETGAVAEPQPDALRAKFVVLGQRHDGSRNVPTGIEQCGSIS